MSRFSRVPRSARYLSASLLWLPLAHAAAQEWDCRQDADGWQCRPGQPGAVSEPAAVPAAAPRPTRRASPPPPAPPAASEPAPAAALPPAERRPLTDAVASASAPANASVPTADNWDWVPASQLDATQRNGSCCAVPRGCGGAYIEPGRDWPDAERTPEGAAVRASSGSSEWQGDQVALQNQVILTQGNMHLSANDGEFDRKQNRAKLRGGVVMRQPGLKLSGDSADLDTRTGLGDIEQARFLDYASGARATATRLSRTSEQVIELEQASYTQCPPNDEDWHLTASRIRLDRDSGRGTAKHTVLRVGDVPVFYSPYLNFPIDDRRQTGFLWPSIGTSGDGLDIAAPYYLNLAPNYDATLTPRHITDRGTMLEAELRYLDPNSRWELAGADLHRDEATDEERWLVSLDQQGQYGTHWNTFVDYNKVSDNDYFNDFSITSLNIRRETHLTQQAGLGFSYGRWNAGLAMVQYQTLDDLVAEPYRKLPQFTLRRSAANTNFDLDYEFFAEATRFENRDSIDEGGPFITGSRYYTEPGIIFPMRWAAGYIAPELRMRYVGYELDETNPGAEENPSAATPLAIVDTGLFFERDTSLGGDAFRQTLEPRLYYLYSEYEEQSDQPNFDTNPLTFTYQQLFQPRRFAGRDRLEDFDQLTVGLTTRYIENRTGREYLSASLGQIQYFDDRRVTLGRSGAADNSSSNVAAQVNFSPSDPVWSSFNALWDPDENKMQQGSLLFHWETERAGLYNIGYRYYRASDEVSTLTNGIDQVDLSAVWPIADRWRVFARWNYDIDDNRSLEDLFGVEYEDCCWLVRVLYQNAVEAEELDALGIARADRDEAILVEFQLKGLGSLGRKASNLLEESIWGYRERE